MKCFTYKSINVTLSFWRSYPGKKMTVKKIFDMADEFYKSLGLEAMPCEFWEKSMLTKPADKRNVVCQASSWDMCKGACGNDVR
jgi:hypothetical protein